MQNAKEEFLNIIAKHPSPVKCAYVRYESYRNISSRREVYLPIGFTNDQLQQFIQSLDFEYNNRFGYQQLHGNIWFEDGTWNQTVVGGVLIFPVKDIAISLENKSPMTSENTALADFDMTVVYAISPSAVSELYSTKSKSFHTIESDGDMLLMHNYMSTLVNNAAYKVVRNYTNLQAADNRQKIEDEIRALVTEQLKTEKLDSALTLNVVQVRNILPNAAILQSATDLVASQNALKVKENEIKIAEAEARRMQMLTSNAGQSIAYMNAQSLAAIAEGVKNGKVHSVVVPYDFKGIIQVGK